MLLSRNEILAVNDRRTETVPIPEWGKEAQVLVRMMSAQDRELYESWMLLYRETRDNGIVAPQQLYARMAVLSCVDEQGDALFSMNDVEWLSQKSYAALKRIFDVAWRLNLFSPDEVEEAIKNSEDSPNASSGTASPLPLADEQ